MTLLIVDDEYYAVTGIRDGLNWGKLPFSTVLDADSAENAQKVIKEQKIDVLLCDIEMPGGSGLSLVEWTREHSPDTVCLLLTCHDEFSFVQKALRLGCMDYVLKPPVPDMLESVLLKAAEQHRGEAERKRMEQYGKKYLDTETFPDEVKTDYIAAAEAYIRENIREQFTVADLADRAGISPDHLARLFRKKHGQTISEYATSLRLQMAKAMIIMTIPISAAVSEKLTDRRRRTINCR